MTPQRIQRKRTKGWRMPEGAVYVGRPTKWGNPYLVTPMQPPLLAVSWFRRDLTAALDGFNRIPHASRSFFAEAFNGPDDLFGQLRELRGKDLCCWCPLDAPCHADVLLELANA